MISISHELRIYDTSARVLLDVLTESRVISLRYGLGDCVVGVLEFDVAADEPEMLFRRDGLVEIYLSLNGVPQLVGDTAFFIRQTLIYYNSNGVKLRRVTAYSAFELLTRRIIAYAAGTSYASKYMTWDDMLREIVDENFCAGASYGGDSSRNIEPWLTVESDQSWGPSYYKDAAWKPVLEVLQDIILGVRSRGVYATFDVIRTDVARFEFRVFLGARGQDHTWDSALPVIVSEEFHNLAPDTSGTLLDDWSDEKNYIYALGQGEGLDRVVKTAFDEDRIEISPFGRREAMIDSRQSEDEDFVQAEADAELEKLRPRKLFSGSIVQTEDCIYGIHWTWGSEVTVQFMGSTMDCRVSTVRVTRNSPDGEYTVSGQLRSLDDI